MGEVKMSYVQKTIISGKVVEVIKKYDRRHSPGKHTKFNKSDIDNILKVEIESKDIIEGLYRTTTNLSTIKSQISKGRQLIQSMVKKKFKELEENGIE